MTGFTEDGTLVDLVFGGGLTDRERHPWISAEAFDRLEAEEAEESNPNWKPPKAKKWQNEHLRKK